MHNLNQAGHFLHLISLPKAPKGQTICRIMNDANISSNNAKIATKNHSRL
jgi:hypothetical protein